MLYCVTSSVSATKDFVKVDSAVYSMKDGSKLVYFVLSNQLNTTNYKPMVQVRSFNSTNSQNKLSDVLTDNPTTTSSPPSPSTTNLAPETSSPSLSTTLIPLSQSSVASPIYNLPILRGQYIELTNQSFNAYLLNLSQSLLNLTSVDNSIMFPSKLYGTVYQADHTVFMTTWLAYIGYIMAIVIILLHAVFIGN